MTRLHATTPPKHHSPAVWAAAEGDYHEGKSGRYIEATYGIKPPTFYKRMCKAGRTRKAMWTAQAAAIAEASRSMEVARIESTPGPLRRLEDLGSIRLAETTLLRAWEAIEAGRAGEALTLTKAAHELGLFAETLVLLKKSHAEDLETYSEEDAPKWGTG